MDSGENTNGVSVVSKQPSKRKKRLLWIGLAIGGIATCALICGFPFISMFFIVQASINETKKEEAKIRKPEMYEPVAKRLALYCQSDLTSFPEHISYAWLPPEMSEFKHAWGDIKSNTASIELGGGFYHFGYRLDLDSASSISATNTWRLVA